MTLFSLTIGDYSGDGHSRAQTYYLDVDGATREQLAENYAKNVAEFGFGLQDFASEYENDSISGEQLLTLLKAGFVDEPVLVKDPEYPGRDEWRDGYIIEPEDDYVPPAARPRAAVPVTQQQIDLNGGMRPAKPWQDYLEAEGNEDDEPEDPWENISEIEVYPVRPGAMFRIATFFFTHGLEGVEAKPVQIQAEPLLGWHGVVDGFVGYGSFFDH